MTALERAGDVRLVAVDDVIAASDDGHAHRGLPRTMLGWLTTTDHKALGIAYAITSLVFLAIGGTLAGIIRAELAQPELQVVGEATYNSVFTIHGSVMVYLFAVPFGFALANYLVPLQIGAPDLAFPRLNALSYWLYLFGGIVMLLGFATDGGAASCGWTCYPPLAGPSGSPGLGADLWVISIILTGTSGTLTAVNVITTVTMLRAPGMTLFRMPILTWNLFLTSFMVLLAFPVLTGALVMLEADRRFGTHFFDPAAGGSPVLWQHLFWFFGHPEVYIVALPFFGVVTEILPVFSRRPVFGYKGLVLATLAISALSTSVWAHHMFVTGQVVLPFFAATSFLIAVPTGIKVFTWIGTMWGGSLSFEAPMLFCLGFLVTFVAGGLTGVMLASPTLDFHLSDTYFVVAHFHYVMGGTVVFALFAAIYFWWPKVTGRMLSTRLGTIHFWLLIIGFNLTFFFMHLLGRDGGGGRVFASHYHYAWFSKSPDAVVNGVASWSPIDPGTGFNEREPPANGNPATTPVNGDISTAFPKAVAMNEWLTKQNALPGGKLPIFDARHNIDNAKPPTSLSWITVPTTKAGITPPNTTPVQYLSFNTPIGAAEDKVCGRVVVSDIHVAAQAGATDSATADFPDGCVTTDLTAQQKALEFMLFDLSSCIQKDDAPIQGPK